MKLHLPLPLLRCLLLLATAAAVSPAAANSLTSRLTLTADAVYESLTSVKLANYSRGTKTSQGAAISSTANLTLSGCTGSFEISGNRLAYNPIDTELDSKFYSLYNNPSLRGGAISCAGLTIENCSDAITFSGNEIQYIYMHKSRYAPPAAQPVQHTASGSVYGGAIHAQQALFSGNGDISFSNNAITAKEKFYSTEYNELVTEHYFTSIAKGAAIYCSDASFRKNGNIQFTGNQLAGEGAAIYSAGGIDFTENASVTISGNDGNSLFYSSGDVVFKGNNAISITDNFGIIENYISDYYIINAKGAIRFSDNGSIVISESAVTNRLHANGSIEFLNNDSISLDSDMSASSILISGTTGDVFLSGGISAPQGGLEVSDNEGPISLGGVYDALVSLANNQSQININGTYEKTLTLTDNKGDVLFGSCTLQGENSLVSGTLGSVTIQSLAAQQPLTLRGNQGIFVSGGTVTGTINLSGNHGDIRFENAACSADISFTGNGQNIIFDSNAQALGATCSFTDNQGSITFQNNAKALPSVRELRFSGNEGAILFSGNNVGRGGVIRRNHFDLGVVSFQNNKSDILFLNNQGTAIYGSVSFSANKGKIEIDGNDYGLITGGSNDGSSSYSWWADTFEDNEGIIAITQTKVGAGIEGRASFSRNAEITISHNATYGITTNVRYNAANMQQFLAGFTDNIGPINITHNGMDGIKGAASFSGNKQAITISQNQKNGLGEGDGMVITIGGFHFDNNEGAIIITDNGLNGIDGEAAFSGNKQSITISKNTYNGILGAATFSNNEKGIDVSYNQKSGISSGTLAFSDNASITVSHNGEYGIYANDLSVTFQGNHGAMDLSSNKYTGIFAGETTITSNAGDINFSENGGAGIYANSLTMTENRGDIVFSGNRGGAIDVQSTVNISNNHSPVVFLNNQANNDAGGIYSSSSITLADNLAGIRFVGNSSICDADHQYPGAIYGGGDFIMRGNGDVLFEGNTFANNDLASLWSLVLNNSAYDPNNNGTIKTMEISAPAGKSICFRDSIYVTSGYAISFNKSYTDGVVTVKPAGDIVFDASHALDDLSAKKEELGMGAVTDVELVNSVYSQIYSDINLYGGRLILNGAGFIMNSGNSTGMYINVSGAGTELRLQNNAYLQTTVIINTRSRLHLEGSNSLRGNLGLFNNSFISFNLSDENLAQPLLTIGGNILLANASAMATMIVDVQDDVALAGGNYQLLSVAGTNQLGLGSLTVCDAEGNLIDMSRLEWKRDPLQGSSTLYLMYGTVELPTLTAGQWTNASGSGVWSDRDKNWVQDGENLPFSPGAAVTFGDAGAGTITLSGTLEPGVVTVDSSQNYVWASNAGTPGSIAGSASLLKLGGGSLTIQTANSYTGGTTLRDGQLAAGHAEAFGTGEIALEGGELNLAGQEVANPIVATGEAQLKGASVYQGKLTLRGGRLSGTSIRLSKAATLESGSISNNLLGTSYVTKTTAGTVVLSGTNTYTGTTVIAEGTLQVQGSLASNIILSGGVLDTGAGMALKRGQTLTAGGGRISGNLATAADSRLDALGDLSIQGGLTLGGGTLSLGNGMLRLTGTLALTGATRLELEGRDAAGSYTLIEFGALSGSLGHLELEPLGNSRYTQSLSAEGGKLVLNVEGTALALTWTAGSGIWGAQGGSPWQHADGGQETFQNGDSALFDRGGSVTLQGNVSPSSVRVEGSQDVEFLGTGGIAGSATLEKRGGGALRMNAANSYSGGTLVMDGQVIAGGAASFGSGAIRLSGGSLDMGGYAVANEVYATGGSLEGSAYAGALTVDGELGLAGRTTARSVLLASGSISGGNLADTAIELRGGSLRSPVEGRSSVTVTGNATIAGTHTYIGPTTIERGTLTLTGGLASNIILQGGVLATGAGLSLRQGQTLTLNGGDVQGGLATAQGSGILFQKAGTIQGDLTLGGGTLEFGSAGLLDVQGGLRLTAATTLLWNGPVAVGSYELLHYDDWEGTLSLLEVAGLARRYELNADNGTLYLQILRDSVSEIVFDGGSNIWSHGEGGFQAGDRVIFRGSGTATLAGNVRPSSVVAEGSGSFVWKGEGSVDGATSLLKRGSGTLAIRTTNAYMGGTELKGGTLDVQADGALGSGVVQISGGKLNIHHYDLGGNDIRISAPAEIASSGGRVQALAAALSDGLMDGSGNVLFAGSLTLTGTLYCQSLEWGQGGNATGGRLDVEGDAAMQAGAFDTGLSIGGNLAKSGRGNVSLLRETLVQGDVDIQAGSLTVGKDAVLRVAQGSTIVSAGSELKLQGKLESDLRVHGGGAVLLEKGAVFQSSSPCVWQFYGGSLCGNLATNSRTTLEIGQGGMRIQGNLTLGGGSLALAAGATLNISGTLTLSVPTTLSGDWSPHTTYTLIQCGGFENAGAFDLNEFFGLDAETGTLAYAHGALTLTTGARPRLFSLAATETDDDETSASESAVATGKESAEQEIARQESPEPQANDTLLSLLAALGQEDEKRHAATCDALCQANWQLVRVSRAFADALHGQCQQGSALEQGASQFWVSTLGGAARMSSDGGRRGSDSHFVGGMVGLKSAVGPQAALGMAAGQATGRVTPSGLSRMKQSSSMAALFGQYRLRQSPSSDMWLDASLAMGSSETKQADMPGSWSQHSWQADMRLTWLHALSESLTLNAYGALQYIAVDNARFGDADTGSLQNGRVEAGAGVAYASGPWYCGGGLAVHGDALRQDPSPNAGPVSREGSNPGRMGIQARFNASYRMSRQWSLQASYACEITENDQSHNASMGVLFQF